MMSPKLSLVLLVLDDVWNEDHNECYNLRTSLSSGVEGSKIIVTTRSEKIATIMGTTYIHHLEGLFEDNCWALFKQRTYGHNEDHHPNLSTNWQTNSERNVEVYL
ncbi:hypothetical protein SO802_032639 [Lithocarpus litseifolius]|uniref:NB-ARC domain-containing protein n=1 Tax=Lithocarpus litseifolius TaxID=425828 RepID=A0AAW2BDU0_9ROSI